jgi:hypothetical protein
MIEEPGAATAQNEFSDPWSGATSAVFENHSNDPVDADADDGAGLGRAGTEDNGSADPSNESTRVLEAVADALAAPDPQTFLRRLVAALGQVARAPITGESSLGTTLYHLGHALEQQLDEGPAFQGLVDAFDRKRLSAEPLNEAVPIVAAFVARIVSRPLLRNASGAMPAEIPGLVQAATEVARGALESDGARGWRTLPAIATTIARRAAQRNLSIGTLAEVLPRLWGRLGPGASETARSGADYRRNDLNSRMRGKGGSRRWRPEPSCAPRSSRLPHAQGGWRGWITPRSASARRIFPMPPRPHISRQPTGD